MRKHQLNWIITRDARVLLKVSKNPLYRNRFLEDTWEYESIRELIALGLIERGTKGVLLTEKGAKIKEIIQDVERICIR